MLRQHLLFAIAAIIVAASAQAAGRQGTRQDYERAAALPERARNTVFPSAVRPEWIGQSSRFWYRNDLPGGKRAFVLVDPDRPGKRPAFDHARLAAALSRTLARPVAAERLPFARIAFTPDEKEIRLTAGDRSLICDLATYAIRDGGDLPGQTAARSLEAGPNASRTTGEETSLTFVNRTGGEVRLFWLDPEGNRRDYGTVPDGGQRQMHTFAQHVWLVVKAESGVPLAKFVATEDPGTAVINGTVTPSIVRPAPPPGLSPDGKWTVTWKAHNLFVRETATGQETPLTTNGSAADSYEARVYWSPDSQRVMALQTIPEEDHDIPLIESSPRDQKQPKLHTRRYLKPGDRIAHHRPRLFDMTARRAIPIADTLFPQPWSLSGLRWEPDGKRFTFVYNQRGHQVMRLIAVDAETGAAQALIDERSDTFICYSGKSYLSTLDKTREAIWMSERDGWNHLYLYDTTTGRVKNQITKGNWVVRDVDRVDEEARQVWFRAGGIRPGQDPYYVHYCRVNFDGTGLTVLTEGDGTHTATFSPDRRFFVDTWSRVDLPPVSEVRRADDGKRVLVLEQASAAALLKTGWKAPERFVAKARDNKTDIYGVIYRPTNFDPKRRYPVIEQIYAGPQSAYVPKAFAAFHGPQRLAELGFIVVQCDGMGTSLRSKAFHDVAWKNLADAGFPDRIAWIRAAGAKYPYMDLSRVGIYGTSAGGQNALGGLLLHPDFYKAGVADCGCHDNRMDKIWWNEQWMGWPVGPHYEAQSNVTLAPRLRGKLLLMVGEMDTNVDPASTMQVADALIKADRDFDLLVAPGVGHGVAATPYGRRRLHDFFVRHLLGVEPRRPAAPAPKPGAKAKNPASRLSPLPRRR